MNTAPLLRGLAAATALLLTGCASPTTELTALPSGSWTLDDGHSSVTWQVRHMGLSLYTARFDTAEAVLDFDADTPEASQLTAIIDAASVSTGDPDFDQVLRDSWLHAGNHPQIIFTTTNIQRTGDTSGIATGLLTLNGREREATMQIEFYGGLYNFLEGRNALGFAGDMTIDRSDFGVGNLPASIVGHEVHIHIEAEFLQQEPAQ
jgi:polyisoprenoid-binding protein YceI